MNPNKALWEKGDFTEIAAFMRQSGEALIKSLGIYPSYSAFAAIYCEKADLPAACLPAGRAGRRQGRLDGFTLSLIEGHILMQTSVKEVYLI